MLGYFLRMATLCLTMLLRNEEGKMNQQKINTSGNQNNWSRFINDVMHGEELTIKKIDKHFSVSSPYKYKTTGKALRREEIEERKEIFESTCSEMWIG